MYQAFIFAVFAVLAFGSTAKQEQNADHTMLKRAVGLESKFAKGLRAVNTLLKGARKYPRVSSNPKDLEFVKKGGLLEALQDFHAVSPNFVRTTRTTDGVSSMGFVGDRTIVLKASKNADPVITVQRSPASIYINAKRNIITYKRQSQAFDEAPELLFQ